MSMFLRLAGFADDRSGVLRNGVLGTKLKLKISSEKRLIILQRLLGIPLHSHFYPLADGIRDNPSYSSPNPPDDALRNSQLELLPGGEGQKMTKVRECLFLKPR